MIIFLVISCQEEVTEEDPCIPSEKILLNKYKDSIQTDTVLLSKTFSVRDVIDYSIELTGKDFCKESGLILATFEEWKEPIWFNALIIPDCDDEVISCGHYSVEILINQEAQILLEGDLCAFDSLRIATRKASLEFTEIGKDVSYYVQWDRGLHRDSLLRAFEYIIQAQADAGDSVAMMNYGKTLCDLDSAEQIDMFSHYRPIFVFQKNYFVPPVPPPPPVYHDGVIDTVLIK